MSGAAVGRALRGIDFLATLPAEVVDDLAARCRVDTRKLGELVFRQGEPGDRFYIVLAGSVRVLRELDGGARTTLGTLSEGSHFGEVALLGGGPRSATVQAASDVELASLSRDEFEAILAPLPAFRAHLVRWLPAREILNFVRLSSDLGRAARAADVVALVEARVERTVPDGEAFAVRDALAVVLEGEVEVSRTGGAPLVTLRPGAALGEDEVVGPSAGLAGRASGVVRLVEFPRAAVEGLLGPSPRLAAHIRERSARWRELAGATGPAGGATPRAPEPAEAVPGPEPAESPPPAGDRPIRRFPFRPQEEQADCGAACLQMVLAHHGCRVSLGPLRDLANVGSSGASMSSLASAAAAVGFEARGWNLDFETLRRTALPAIALWGGSHYVVVYAALGDRVRLADPALGLVQLSREEFLAGWTGRLLTLCPTGPLAVGLPARTGAWSAVAGSLSAEWRAIALALPAGLAASALGVAVPLAAGMALDALAGTGSSPVAPGSLLAGALAAVLGVGLLEVARARLVDRACARHARQAAADALRRFLSLSCRQVGVRARRDLEDRLAGGDAGARSILEPASRLAGAAGAAGAGVAALLALDPQLLAPVAGALVLGAAGAALRRPLVARLEPDRDTASLEERTVREECLAGLGTIQALGLESGWRTRWEAPMERLTRLEGRIALADDLLEAGAASLRLLAVLLVAWLGAHQVADGTASPGRVAAATMLAVWTLAATSGASRAVGAIHRGARRARRLAEGLESLPGETGADAGRLRSVRIQGGVRLEGVSFRYGPEADGWALRRLDLSVEPGQRVVVAGREGAGKTTLARLLTGLHPPVEGRIRIDSFDLSELSSSTFRTRLGVAFEAAHLLAGTVLDNVCAGDETPDTLRMVHAARLALAHDFVTALPRGYLTPIGAAGRSLSPGERQQLAIARAIYRDPAILVLDGATSALDAETEARLLAGLDRFLRGRTTFVLTRRPETVPDPDVVRVLEGGSFR